MDHENEQGQRHHGAERQSQPKPRDFVQQPVRAAGVLGDFTSAVWAQPQVYRQSEEDHHGQGEFQEAVIAGAECPGKIAKSSKGQQLGSKLPGREEKKVNRQAPGFRCLPGGGSSWPRRLRWLGDYSEPRRRRVALLH